MAAETAEVTEEQFAGLPLSRKAFGFARERHEGQRRKAGDEPFVLHPVEVAVLLRDAGYPDEVVAAGLLHEVIEDAGADRDELAERFGPEVAGVVAALSDDPTIEDRQERRAALRLQVATAGREAAAVFAADKVSKARELRVKASRAPLGEDDLARLEHYEESLEMLRAVMPRHELVERLRLELETIRLL